MKLVKTVRCKLQVNTEQAAILLETLQRFAAACNDILHVSQENRTTNKVKLQHLCYRTIKEKYGLQANLVIRAIEANTFEELLQKIADFHDTKLENLQVENGIIHVETLEIPLDDRWISPDEKDLEDWKQGKKEIYSCHYSYKVYKQELVN